MRKTPKVVFSIGALTLAAKPAASSS